MNEKFTKGPLKAVFPEGSNGFWHVESQEFDEVCICYGYNAQNEAHLIAAAPDMYEMLNRMQAVMYHLSNEIELRDSKRMACRDDFSKINELLAKARGEN